MLIGYRKLVRIAESYREQIPKVRADKRHLGVVLTLVGFILYSVFTTLFQLVTKRDNTSNSLSIVFFEFTVFHFFMMLSFFPFCLAKGRHFFKCKLPWFIVFRAVFSIICVLFYILSRFWAHRVDNSMLYSTDPLWVVLILLFLGMYVSWIAIAGVFIGIAAVVFVYLYNSSAQDVVGASLGTVSGILLAFVIFLTRFMVQKDPPLRIGFYQALIGFAIFGTGTIFWDIYNGWNVPSWNAIMMMMFSGFLFALTLFCFIEAFYYTEVQIIAGVSFFLPVFNETFNWMINQTIVSTTTIIGSVIITIGGLMAIYASDRNNKIKNNADI